MNRYFKTNKAVKLIIQIKDWIIVSRMRLFAIITAFILLVYLPIFTAKTIDNIDLEKRRGSAKHLFLLAYHIQHHHTFSMEFNDSENVAPTSYRPPGYPFFLAICMTIIPEFNGTVLNDFVTIDEDGEKYIDERKNNGFYYIKYCEAFLHFLISLMAMWIAWKLTNNPFFTIIVLFWVGLHSKLGSSVSNLHTEILYSFLATLFSVILIKTVEKKKYLMFALSGILLGCLTLTRATWYYYCIPGALFYIFVSVIYPEERRKIYIGTIVYLFCFALIAGSWMVRNYYVFDRAYIAGRGGHVLDIRMNHNMMNSKEFTASFLLWSRSKIFKEDLLKKYFKYEDYKRLDRGNSDGFYRTARKRGTDLSKIHGPIDGGKVQLKEAIHKFIKHPFKHLLVTIPITYRGIQKFGKEFISITLLFFLIFVFANAIIRKNYIVITMLLPTMFMFSFNCFATHNLPRYNLAHIPIFIVSSLIGVDIIWKFLRSKIKLFSSN